MNIIDQNALLTSEQKDLLRENANKAYSFGGFISLDDIVTRLKVDVIIEQGTPIRCVDDYYEKAIDYWRKVYNQLAERARLDESLWNECQKAERKLGRLYSERQAHSSMILLGLYDSQKNVIKLFPEAMAKANPNTMNEYLVSTFAHEVMHAYFNRPGHDKYPYAMFVEEPLAEFGMLLYLHETHSNYYDWAHDNVSNKNCCYGYGANFMYQYLGGDKSLRKILEEYKILIEEYEMLDNSNGRISLPEGGGFVNTNGGTLAVQWIPALCAPTYFYDKPSKTLGLNGYWNKYMYRYYKEYIHHCYHIKRDFHVHFEDEVQHLYLGENFECEDCYYLKDLFSTIPITISSKNKKMMLINGILVRRDNHIPLINSRGNGYYELKKNGKYGIIDSQLNNVTPFIYDYIWDFEKNNLCKVERDHKFGYVNANGEEQVAVKYDDIESFEMGLAVAKLGRYYGIINEQDEVVVPFNLDYLDMRGLENGYATMKGYNNKWGTINAQGQVVIPCEYDSLIVFNEDGFDRVRKDGEEFIIDVFGNRKS